MFLSIIIPCYNEGHKLQYNLPIIYNYLFNNTTNDITFEIIVVNDGSTDDTEHIILNKIKPSVDIYKNNKFINFKVVTYPNNQGKGFAVKQGISKSDGDYCLFMDTDLSTDLSAIQDVIKYTKQGLDVIIGSRTFYKNNKFINFKVVTYPNNQGKGFAVKQGISKSDGDYCLFMDTDLSTDLSAIQDVIKYTKQGLDVIIGSRTLKESKIPIKRNFIRKLVSKSCKIITNSLIPLKDLSDTQCGFKTIKTDFAKNVLITHQTISRFAFDIEYLYMAKLYNKTIKEIPVLWIDDNDSRVKIAKSSIDFIKSLIQIRKNKEYYLH